MLIAEASRKRPFHESATYQGKDSGVSETWLSDSNSDVMMSGYKFFYKNRVGIFISNDTEYSDVEGDSLNILSFEFLVVTIKCNSQNDIMLEVTYRPPNASIRIFNDE